MTKRNRKEEIEEDQDVSMLDAIDENDDMDKEINMEFQFFQFQQENYHQLKTMLRNYLDGTPYEIEALCDEIIEQFYIGSSIKIEDNDQFVGLLTEFNITKHSEKPCVKSIKKFFVNNLRDSNEKDSLREFLDGKQGQVGLVLSERIESVPVLLTPHLYIQLGEEIGRAYQTELDDKLVTFEYKLDYLLLKSKVFYVRELEETKKSKTKKVQFDQPKTENELERCFQNPEEELLEQFAEKVWLGKSRTLDCTNPNSMGRHVVKEEFLLFAIPIKHLPMIGTTLNKIISPTAEKK